MASASSLLSEDMFQCSICLDVFNEPVSTPCGHNYCKACITRYWDTLQDQCCCCPMCKKCFVTRPDLLVNTLISEMAVELRKRAALKADLSTNTDGPNQGAARLKEVPCDVCHGIKLQALKSCLVCLTSYCETHLEPHRRVAALQRHKLIHPVENLEARLCKKHDKMLELFCRTDQLCVCVMCTEHKTHDTVPLEEGYEKTKAQLEKKQTEVEQMIQVRLQKVQEIKRSAVLNKEDTEQETVYCDEVATALVASIQRSQAELIDLMAAEQRAVEKQAEGFISALEQEITELQKSRVEMEKLSHNEDHLHFLHTVPPIFTPMITKEWSQVSVSSHLCGGPVHRALGQLEETLGKETKALLKRMEDMVDLPEDVKLKRIQQRYAVDVTLDPDTAHRRLILSDNRKRVWKADGDPLLPLPTYPNRFDERSSVLGKEGFSAGRFYYEVQVGGKTQWDLGLVRQSITRKWITSQNPETGYWIIQFRDGRCSAAGHRSIPLILRGNLEKIGVFVDYEAGLISFYDVEAKHLLFSFSGYTFTEKMYPYLGLCAYHDGENAAPMIITTPINVIVTARAYFTPPPFPQTFTTHSSSSPSPSTTHSSSSSLSLFTPPFTLIRPASLHFLSPSPAAPHPSDSHAVRHLTPHSCIQSPVDEDPTSTPRR